MKTVRVESRLITQNYQKVLFKGKLADKDFRQGESS
jgi:hypothetical protein